MISMSNYPTLNDRQLRKRLRQKGFYCDRSAKGSHEIWCGEDTEGRLRTTILPRGHDFSPDYATFRNILKDLGLSIKEFYKD